MVGILLAPEATIVPPIKAALSESGIAEELGIRKSTGNSPYTEQSPLFPKAAFVTEHDRPAPLGPDHGYIVVAHYFVAFG